MAISVTNSGFINSMKLQNHTGLSLGRQILKSPEPRSISETFVRLRQQGKVALIPYITAGDPNLSATAEALKVLDSCGSDVIELGVPFSDPFLDGPVIQAASSRSLAGGTNLESIFSMLKVVSPRLSCPVSLFTYYKVILNHGIQDFMAAVNEAGVRGLIVPDVPLDDIDPLRVAASKYGVEIVRLITPITPLEEMKSIVEVAQGFVYLVSSTGVTGVRPSVNPGVESLLQEIKKVTTKPVVVGFGISRPEHVQQISRWGADGVIVGSAMVKCLGEAKSGKEGLKALETFMKSLKSALSIEIIQRGLEKYLKAHA